MRERVETSPCGTGTIDLNRATYARVSVNAADTTLTIGVGQTITGVGRVEEVSTNSLIVMQGSLAPGRIGDDPTMNIELNGDIWLANTSRVERRRFDVQASLNDYAIGCL